MCLLKTISLIVIAAIRLIVDVVCDGLVFPQL